MVIFLLGEVESCGVKGRWEMNRWRVAIGTAFASVAIIISSAVLTGGAIADEPQQVDLYGPNVIRYPTYYDPPLLNSQREIEVGQKIRDGCRRPSITRTFSPGEGSKGSIKIRELALDLSTCEYLVEIGTPPG